MLRSGIALKVLDTVDKFHRRAADSLYNVGAQLFVVFTALSQLVLLTWVFEPEVLGKWFLFLAAIELMSLLVVPGSMSCAVRGFVRGYPGNFRKLLRYRVGLSTICIVIGLALSLFFARSDRDLCLMFLLGAVFFIPYRGINLWEAFFVGTLRFRLVFWARIIRQSLILVFALSMLPFHGSIVIFTLTVLLVESLVNTALTSYSWRNSPGPDEAEPKVFRLSILLSLGDSGFFLASGIEKLLVKSLLGLEGLGVYGTALRVFNFSGSALKQAVAPVSLRRQKLAFDDFQKAALRDAPFLVAGGVVTGLAAITALWGLGPFVLGPGYGQVFSAATIVLLGAPLLPLMHYCRASMSAFRRTSLFIGMSWVYCLGVILPIAVLSPLMGVSGAAAGRALGYVPVVVICIVYLIRKPPICEIPFLRAVVVGILHGVTCVSQGVRARGDRSRHGNQTVEP